MRIEKRILRHWRGALCEVTAPKMCEHIRLTAARAGYEDIHAAYKNPSVYKILTWLYWVDVCDALNGFNIQISSANCQVFSITFEFVHPYDGDACIAYITKDYARFCSK